MSRLREEPDLVKQNAPSMTMHQEACGPTQTPGDIDIDRLREKYRQERAKRLREEGSKQYVELSDDFAGYYETDPHTPVAPRDPISDDVDVAVLGGGFAGLLSAAYLKKAGVGDVRIIELGGDFGGVWYWNRYPGIQCDNESYCYIPLLEELDFMPSKKFADGAEIYEHCRRIGKHFGLYDSAIFSTQVRNLRWDQEIKRWRISTNRDDDIRARFVVMGSGPFHRPKLPGIPGIKDFKGHSFHSSRWDYDYTGGDTTGGLHKLADKRVALVGTGATGVQLVPYLGQDAKHLYVFQRTPSTVDERGNTPTDPGWAKSLKPGWQKERQRNFHGWTFEGMALGQPDLVCDFWTELGRNTAARVLALDDPAAMSPEQFLVIREEEDYKIMERLRRRVEGLVEDGETAETLKPYYRFLCKRPCSNDQYLSTFNLPNVTLVDVSSSKGVERATEKGLVANGVEYEVDCIIYASGFEITTEISRRYSIDAIAGRNGLPLFDYWHDGYKTLHGMTSRGFPNQFFTGFTQVGISANIAANYELQGEHIAYIISEALARGATTVEPSQEAQDEWCTTIRDTAIDNSAFDAECTPGYYNNEGGGGGEGIRSHLGQPYGPGFYAFGDLLKQWREKGDLDGLVLGR
jgi:cyclohexanone monooxygenase